LNALISHGFGDPAQFTFLTSGCDPDDVSIHKTHKETGLKCDQLRYVYFVRSMDIEDSDNPHAHRIYLTAGDLLGKERGSSHTGVAKGKIPVFWMFRTLFFCSTNDSCIDK